MPVTKHAFDEDVFHIETFTASYPHKRIDVVDLHPEITTLTWSTARAGGFQTLAVGYDHAAVASDGSEVTFSHIPYDVMVAPHFAVVRVSARNHCVYEGRIVRRDLGPMGLASFQAKGLGITATGDNTFIAPTQEDFYSSAQVMEIALKSCANNLIAIGGPDLWQDSQIDHHMQVEFNRRQASQIIDQLARAGNGGVWDFAVWERRGGEQPFTRAVASFLPRTPPATPDFWIPWSSAIQNWTEISENAYNHVTVSYTDADTNINNLLTKQYDDSGLSDIYGIDRSITVPAGTICDRCADAFARTYLAQHRLPSIQCTLALNGFHGLEAYNGGAEIPPYLIRADQWIQVADYPQILPIVRTEYNASTGELTLEIGGPTPSYGNFTHELHRAHCAVAGGSNVNLGSKA